MIAPIFRSKLRQDILTLYFTNPDSAFFLRELARRFECSVGSLQRELTCLSKEGILLHEAKGNVKLFRLNKEYPLLSEMTGILQKTIGVAILMQDVFQAMPEVLVACIYGSYVKSPFYLLDPVEVLVIADQFDHAAYQQKVHLLEQGLHRKIMATVLSQSELKSLCDKGDRDMKRILKNPKMIVKGTQAELDSITMVVKDDDPLSLAREYRAHMLQFAK